MLTLVARDGVRCSCFRTEGGEAEHYITVTASGRLGFADQIEQIRERYAEITGSLGLRPGTAIFRRLFLSDAINQCASVRAGDLAGGSDADPVAVSIVQQPPLPAAKVGLLAYHLETRDEVRKKRLAANHLLVEKNGRRHLWSTGLGGGSPDPAPASDSQTRKAFASLIGTLSELGGTLAGHCVRTWIYLKNVDAFYHGMVSSRRELFAHEGLTGDTHFIASTGIEGGSAHRSDVVTMDAYSILDLEPRQVSYLEDLDKLCPTKDYGVTFERGTRIAYADRAHLLISGTASIDRAGKVVHVGDVTRQLERAIENVEALLSAGKACLDDLMYLIVYLRDASDCWRVQDQLRRHFPRLPIMMVAGAVCRPEWLVEIEGVAIAPNAEPAMPAF